MKKKISILFLMTIFVSTILSLPAAASTTANGFYNIENVGGVTITPYAESAEVTVENCDVDGDGITDTWYKNSDWMKVSYNMATEGYYYGLIMVEGKDVIPTVDNTIYYVDQITATSNVVDFEVYPLLPEETTDLTIYISSDAENHELVRINLSYATDVESVTTKLDLGDANGDGEVDFADAIVVLKHDAGVTTLTGDNLTVADTNSDGEVDFVDAMQILKYDCGLISSFN